MAQLNRLENNNLTTFIFKYRVMQYFIEYTYVCEYFRIYFIWNKNLKVLGHIN